jgi:hypothetical protein
MIKLAIGFDQREAVAYHTFVQSVLENATRPVSFIPLAANNLPDYKESHTDGSNTFIYKRFLTPYICEFQGWAIFADGDMVCNSDIGELWDLRDETRAVLCVKHNYKTRAYSKYLGNKNEDYPRKNWSSLVLWNCGHPSNQVLTPQFVSNQTGAFLHRFCWLKDEEIGGLPTEWNWLATEYDDNSEAKLLHYTLGTPCFKDYKHAPMSRAWHLHHERSQEGMNG